MFCVHLPPCPAASRPDHEAARVVATHPEQGWSLRCNGVVTFDDNGELFPDGRVTASRDCAGLALATRPGVPVRRRAPASGGRTH